MMHVTGKERENIRKRIRADHQDVVVDASASYVLDEMDDDRD